MLSRTFYTERVSSSAMILRGIFSLAIFVIALAFPRLALISMAMLFGTYLLVDGVLAIATDVPRQRGLGDRRWGWTLFEGLIGVLAGLGALIWPVLSLVALSALVGIWAVATGLIELIGAFRLPLGLRQHKVFRLLLGLAGVVSILVGVGMVLVPPAGAIALMSLLAIYAGVFGVIEVIHGIQLRRVRARQITVGSGTGFQPV